MNAPTVHFKDTVRVRRIKSINCTSDNELNARWYSSEDFRTMQRRDVLIQNKLSKKEKVYHENHYFVHGLETENHRALRKFNIDRSRLTLLMEQERQWKENDSQNTAESMEVLRTVYSNVASDSRVLARMRGIAMAEHVVQGNIKSAICGVDDVRTTQPAVTAAPAVSSPQYHSSSQEECLLSSGGSRIRRKESLETFQTPHVLRTRATSIRTRSPPLPHQRRGLRMMTNSPCGRR